MEVLRPLKAIRMKCLDCCGGSSNEVKLCDIDTCTLWPYRSGHRPGYVKKAHAREGFAENDMEDEEIIDEEG